MATTMKQPTTKLLTTAAAMLKAFQVEASFGFKDEAQRTAYRDLYQEVDFARIVLEMEAKDPEPPTPLLVTVDQHEFTGKATMLKAIADTAVAPKPKKLSEDQEKAWAKLKMWAANDKPYFVLRGFAGTGKTFLMQKLNELPGATVFFTAPTNKAAKVLGTATNTLARTTFSFLGLRMGFKEDQMILEYSKEPPYIPKNSILVVDEASMTGTELVAFIEEVRALNNCKVLFVGDPAQLPPIGEHTSPSWSCTTDPLCRAVLKQVMRTDNQVLTLSMRIRDCLQNKTWASPLVNDHSNGEGVFKFDKLKFDKHILGLDIDSFANTKVAAWRNKTVDSYTRKIRKGFGFKYEYSENELVMLASPIEEEGTLVAHTDEEFRIVNRRESKIRIDDHDIPVYSLDVKGDTSPTLYVPIDDAPLNALLASKAAAARNCDSKRQRGQLWRDFWETKNRFHSLRYGYAMTAHRLQGSTLESVYIDQNDILVNPVKREAFRCLYVAATRPTTRLYSF